MRETISYAAAVMLLRRFPDSVDVEIRVKKRLGLLDYDPSLALKENQITAVRLHMY